MSDLSTSRASQRRHDTGRVKARYLRRERLHPYWNQRTAKAAGQYANHGCTCSCHMCGNPRKHFNRPTLAEVRAVDAHRDGVEDSRLIPESRIEAIALAERIIDVMESIHGMIDDAILRCEIALAKEMRKWPDLAIVRGDRQ